MAPRKPVSAPPSGGGLKDLLSPRSPLEAAQNPVILKGAPGGSPEIAGIHAKGRENVADKQLPENGKPKVQAVGREMLKGAYVVESKTSDKENGSHGTGSARKERSPELKEEEEAEGDRNKKLKSAQLKELGNAHFAKKDFQSAAEYYTQALEFDSKNAVLYANKANERSQG
jgi:tetratricopeptide (TPR) repeat protein